MNQTFGASGATIRSLKPPRISPTHWYLACKNHVFEALFLFLPIIIFHLPNRSVNYTSGSPKAPSESWHHLKYPPHSWLLPSMILDILKSCCQNQYESWNNWASMKRLYLTPLSCKSIYLIHSKRQYFTNLGLLGPPSEHWNCQNCLWCSHIFPSLPLYGYFCVILTFIYMTLPHKSTPSIPRGPWQSEASVICHLWRGVDLDMK